MSEATSSSGTSTPAARRFAVVIHPFFFFFFLFFSWSGGGGGDGDVVLTMHAGKVVLRVPVATLGGRWVHVAWVLHDGVLHGYVNGVRHSSARFAQIQPGTTPLPPSLPPSSLFLPSHTTTGVVWMRVIIGW